MELVPCDQSHEAQVYGSSDLPGWTDFTDDGALAAEVKHLCDAAAAGYAAGPGQEEEIVYPASEGWATVSRNVSCLFMAGSGRTTSSVIPTADNGS